MISILLSSLVVYKTRDSLLGFSFGFLLGFLLTERVERLLIR